MQRVAAIQAHTSQYVIIGAASSPDGWTLLSSSLSAWEPQFMGVAKGTVYTAAIQTINADGTSSPFSTSFQVAAAELSSPPVGVTLCSASATACPPGVSLTPQPLSLTAAWAIPLDTGRGASLAADILFYSIELSTSSNFSLISYTRKAPHSTPLRFQVGGLVKSTRYYCRIRAVTAAGYSNYSDIAGPRTVLDISSPPIVNSVTASSAGSAFYLAITWSIPSDTGDHTNTLVAISEYDIEISNSSDFSQAGSFFSVTQVIPGANQQSFLFDTRYGSSNLNAYVSNGLGKSMFMRIRAKSVLGFSNYSTVQSVRLVNTPSAPTSLTIAKPTVLTLQLSWSTPADNGLGAGVSYPLTQYAIQIQTILPAVTYPLLFTGPNQTQLVISSLQDSPLTRGVLYYITVQALNDVGSGPWFSPQPSAYAVGLSTAPNSVNLCSFDATVTCGNFGFTTTAGPRQLRYAPPPPAYFLVLILRCIKCTHTDCSFF